MLAGLHGRIAECYINVCGSETHSPATWRRLERLLVDWPRRMHGDLEEIGIGFAETGSCSVCQHMAVNAEQHHVVAPM
jgi:hypothetical protein